ncbi:ead/Ea22-like family protein [Leclercia adecarboxylata]|uniref:ead/Ea22-like family protein n=1 Tax=Leclercia adecarboxylata TaxID=83655 RepID=UPI001CD9C426|nr:ead/Ea22-like family protein [Leclercia adecarboxylata]
MSNINELTAKLKAAAQDEIMCREACDTSDLWQDVASPENVLALLNENARLMAERDALREAMGGDNTRAAADIYFQLVEECEIPANGSLVEYVDNMRDELEAAEKRIAELEAREVVLPSVQDVHPLGPQSAKIFCEFHREIINRCADEIRKVGVNVSIKGE